MWKKIIDRLQKKHKMGSQIAVDNSEAEPILDSNQATTEKYIRLERIGKGSVGEVWLAENKVTKKNFAMKCIPLDREFDKYLTREIIIQNSLCHSNVIQFVEVVLSLPYLGIVMEHANGGDLYDKIFSSAEGLDEIMARYYFQQLISGLSYCHSKDICHRDLKPENILLTKDDPPCLKICDFGFSKSNRLHSKPKSVVGTPQYWAPEVRLGREYDGKLADLWSCGVILYTMLMGKHPICRPDDTEETSNVHETNACPFLLPNSLSADSKDLLARMLVEDPKKRITIEDVKKHKWLKKKLKRKRSEATQEENPRLSLQSDEEIKKMVEKAKIRQLEDGIGIKGVVKLEEEEEEEN